MDTQQAITVVIKPCRSCGGGVPESDRFCRLCGERQPAPQGLALEAARESSEAPRDTDLEHSRRPDIGTSGVMEARLSNHFVSGPMVWALSTNGCGPAKSYDPRMKRIVSLLISLPVWLIILLLSPFDAYAAARLITEARWQQEHP